MGWEEILDAEGADMAGAYEDSLPEEGCGTAINYVPEKQYVDVGPYISNMMLDFDDLLICCGLYDHELIVEGDPYVELEDKTCDELIEECIKLGQDAKHAKHALKNAGQDIDTLLDYLDKRVLGGWTVSSEKRKEFRTLIESKVKYEEESMGCDELREKYGSMTRDELVDKHVEISGVKDVAEAISEHIETVIERLGVDLYGEFEDKQDLKDLIAKYEKAVPETMEEDDEAITEKDKEEAQEKHVLTNEELIEKYGQITPAPDDYEFTEADELPL